MFSINKQAINKQVIIVVLLTSQRVAVRTDVATQYSRAEW
jgi:hypothetical protein